MKKFISFALAASMALSMVPATAFAASDLTASHSNIRVTANTEFYPKKVADADASLTTREVPYILLEATTDFKYDEQTFELALENAEWLERKDDGDVLFVETEEYMAGEDGIKFKPVGGSTSTDTTTPGTSEDLGTLEQAYDAAAKALYDAANKFIAAESAAAGAAAQKTAMETALTAYNDAKAATQVAKDTLDEKKASQEALPELVKQYTDAYAKKGDATYELGDDANSGNYFDVTDVSDTTNTASGAFKSDGANLMFYEKPDGNGGYTAIPESDITAPLPTTWKLTNEGNKAEIEYKEYQAAVIYRSEVDDTLDSALVEFNKLGVTVSQGVPDVSAVDAAVSAAQADYDNAVKAEETAKADYEAKKAAYEAAAGADYKTAKDAFDAALATRNDAGIAAINKGGRIVLDDIVKMDNSIGLCDTSGSYANGTAAGATVDYDAIGVNGFELNGVKAVVAGAYDVAVGTETLKVEITKKSDSRVVVKTSGYRFKDGDVLSIPLFVRTTGGTASVSIDSLDSEFTSQGKTFAKTADGDTELSIEKVQNFYDDDEIKNLYLEELVAGTIEPGKIISLRINGDFKMKADKDGVKVTRITGDGGTDVEVLKKDSDNNYVAFAPGDEADEIYLRVKGTAKSTKATQYRIQGLKIVEDGADFGDEASITVSGGGTSKQTIKIGNYEDFGVKLTAEDKDLPVIYAGTMANSKYDNQTLKVTIEETVANSFIDNRKMEITLPEGVEFVNDSGKRGAAPDSIDDVTEDFKVYNFAGSESDVKKAMTLNDNGTKITISGKDLPDASGTNKDRKRKIEFSVHVSAEADFTGDVVMTLGGPGVADKNVSATVATVKAPIEVRTAVNELKIDYRNTEIADITLVEPEAGLWAKDDVINLEGERMSFESGAKAEVVNGDMKLDKFDGDYIDVNDGVLSVKVSSRSSKTPAEIKISGLSLYMDRSLAAGNYKLKVFGEGKNEFFMNNYDKDGDDFANVFETQKVTVMDDFVKIVTAGRDKDDATFTTKIVVPVGGDVITAGTKEIKLSEMQGGACPPAYINNDGYTMLPVRAVVEALNEIATVRWDDATKTCTIGFGQRVFSMTVGSKVLNLNGVSTALNAAPENKDGRVFLPLRDLGYALGLSDSQISWDSTTQTAQLN